jgi:hypothetical protein
MQAVSSQLCFIQTINLVRLIDNYCIVEWHKGARFTTKLETIEEIIYCDVETLRVWVTQRKLHTREKPYNFYSHLVLLQWLNEGKLGWTAATQTFIPFARGERKTWKFCLDIYVERGILRDRDIYGRIILKRILRKSVVRMWTEFDWLMIGLCGRWMPSCLQDC